MLLRGQWALADQALSALTNFAVSFLVARSVSAEEFGAFSASFLVFSMVIGVQRAIAGTPLSIRYASVDPAQRPGLTTRSLGASLSLGLIVSSGLLVWALLVDGPQSSAAVALALVLPGLILQDGARMAFFAWARPQGATLLDGVWAILQLAGLGVVFALGPSSAASIVLVWGLAAAASAALGVWMLKAVPAIRQTAAWLRATWDLGGHLTLTFALQAGVTQGLILLLGGSLGLGDIGSVRAAQVLVGPLSILGAAIWTWLLVEIARLRTVPRRAEHLAIGVGLGLGAVALLYTLLLMLLPDALGEALLGDTWAGAQTVLLPVALTTVLNLATLGPSIFVYAMGQTHRVLRMAWALAIASVVLMSVGTLRLGLDGMVWGMFLAQLLMVPAWLMTLRAAVRTAEPDAGPPA